MKLEIEVKFNIGDKVRVLNPHNGQWIKQDPFVGRIGGYVIHKDKKRTKIYYTIDISSVENIHPVAVHDGHTKKKYLASELELIEEIK